MKELVMSRRELQILTNSIYRGDRRYIHASYPFFDLRLFTMDIEKPELKDVVRPDAFDWARSTKKPLDRSFSADELPSFNDLRNCFLSSGFIVYKNEKEITSKLIELREEARDPNKRARPVFVAVDTNILYDRFLSRHLPMADAEGRTVEASDFRYVVSEVVLTEIDSRITHKYSRDEIRGLAQVLSHPELLNEFANASGRRTRIAKLALNETSYLLGDLRALRIKGSPAEDKEKNDIAIAASYRNWARIGDYDVFLLTADEDMVSHARANELIPLPLELPFAVPEHARIDPWRLSDLIYDLALGFGVISLDNEGMLVFGEWAGKSSTDYEKENVKVRFEDDARSAAVGKQVSMCRTVLDNRE